MTRRLIVLFFISLSALWAQKFRTDDPLEFELPPLPVDKAAKRKLSDYYDALRHAIAAPGDLQRVPARAINTLGEPLQGAWWEKRHYYRPSSIDALIAGPGDKRPPSANGPWTVVGAKAEGVTPGFVMLDAKKELYFVKFDPLTNPEMATGADHISIRLMHALGYHVPENYLIEFDSRNLVIGKDVSLADRLGRRRPMKQRDLDEMLLKAPRSGNSTYRATASRAIAGQGIGPYRYYGRRSDDPNDFVAHEHRRDLRGLAVAAAWIDHDDSRAINTYDALVEEGGTKFIRHYILDLGSSLGSATQQANSARSGGEYLFGWKQSAVQLFTLGLAVQPWARAHFPDIPAAGRFEYERFNPETWVPEYPIPAFLNRLPDDEFWAAKQIVALGDDKIRAIVHSARYSDPRAEAWLTECLIRRRDKIGRVYFSKVLPLDRFEVREGKLNFEDLWEKAGFGPRGAYRFQWFAWNNTAGTATPMAGAVSATLPKSDSQHLLARITDPARPRQSVDVTLRLELGSPAVAGVERTW